ncbi:NUDIX hydrolase [Streptosporangium lutulentum]|uniref:8-oxo-dGTP pyrophosphatase MutT (NUDIX family) n=1 Tax=Streptosporangium lutulentum TaxID=1461250 RepID=A0ABT9QU71_9ACTN|nr:NUDIX hydrolase [Streptosporangium lutulentum]MDP9850317.1 8-oxo-dGTP pyrophosphatase MutT (NUDIX family) [Streptosporangium lutulentum]
MSARCDNRSVGVLIENADGEYLMFDRNTFQPGTAGAAGHVDEHGSFVDAAHAEVAEELGLRVEALTLLLTAWRDNRCRRQIGPAGVGHHWYLYRAQVSGQLAPSDRETRNVRWLSATELQELVERTIAYAHGHLSDADFTARPGIEPVWVRWLTVAGLADATPADLAQIDQIANRLTRS